MFKFSKYIVSLFGIGFISIVPGSVGSLLSLVFFYVAIDYLSFYSLILIFILTFFISLICIQIYSKKIKEIDSSEIVIDEFLGINFIIIYFEYLELSKNIYVFIYIFILFRIFDILKVFPANWVDKNIKNSFGVIMDDIIAGFYCILILYITYAFV